MHPAPARQSVAIILSSFNGARFLPDQLESFAAQTHRDWCLYWRDDGSDDGTVALLEGFAARFPESCRRVPGPPGRIGATASFLTLLAACDEPGVAFADQDDVWLPDKLSRGVAALAAAPAARPVLYCARQMLVDEALRHLGPSAGLRRAIRFPSSLTQNIATGCTVMLNRRAADLVRSSRAPAGTLHDWWSYLLVTAADGVVIADDEPAVLYRQHGANLVGAPSTLPARAAAALRRGPAAFMTLLRQHVVALEAQRMLLSPRAAAEVATIRRALDHGVLRRAAVLLRYGLRRQTRLETALFSLWFLLG